jgi:hypothetical protein
VKPAKGFLIQRRVVGKSRRPPKVPLPEKNIIVDISRGRGGVLPVKNDGMFKKRAVPDLA